MAFISSSVLASLTPPVRLMQDFISFPSSLLPSVLIYTVVLGAYYVQQGKKNVILQRKTTNNSTNQCTKCYLTASISITHKIQIKYRKRWAALALDLLLLPYFMVMDSFGRSARQPRLKWLKNKFSFLIFFKEKKKNLWNQGSN